MIALYEYTVLMQANRTPVASFVTISEALAEAKRLARVWRGCSEAYPFEVIRQVDGYSLAVMHG